MSNTKANRWSTKHERTLHTMYPTTKAKHIAPLIGHSTNAIYSRLSKQKAAANKGGDMKWDVRATVTETGDAALLRCKATTDLFRAAPE